MIYCNLFTARSVLTSELECTRFTNKLYDSISRVAGFPDQLPVLLMEFNKLLRGDKSTSYDAQEGHLPALLPADGSFPIRYVITLDADTQLPPATAR